MHTDITKWLNNGSDFKQGVKLYEKYGLKGQLKKLFKLKGPTQYNVNKLHFELSEIEARLKAVNGNLVPPPEKTTFKLPDVSDFVKHTVPKHAPLTEKDLPPALNKLRVENGARFRYMGALHNELFKCEDQEARGVIAGKILESEAKNVANWKIIDHYLDTGIILLPETTEVPSVLDNSNNPLTEAEIVKELYLIRPNISKNKNKPHRAEQVKLWEARRDELMRLLQNMKKTK